MRPCRIVLSLLCSDICLWKISIEVLSSYPWNVYMVLVWMTTTTTGQTNMWSVHSKCDQRLRHPHEFNVYIDRCFFFNKTIPIVVLFLLATFEESKTSLATTTSALFDTNCRVRFLLFYFTHLVWLSFKLM